LVRLGEPEESRSLVRLGEPEERSLVRLGEPVLGLTEPRQASLYVLRSVLGSFEWPKSGPGQGPVARPVSSCANTLRLLDRDGGAPCAFA
jgi:hypothetical protein